MSQRKRNNNLIFLDNGYQKNQNNRKKHHYGTNLLRRLLKISIKSYLIIFLAILLIFLGYIFSPLGHVQQINVSGVNYIGAQQIIDASQINSDSVVLNTLINKPKICRQIKQRVPLVKSVDYHYHNFNHLVFTVKEYQTVGFIVKHDKYYRVLENVHIVNSKLQQPIGNFPIYQDFGNKTSLKKIVRLYVSLPAKLRNDISEIHGVKAKDSHHPYRITLYMNDGNIVVGDIRTLKSKLPYYPGIASQMKSKGIVNLEVGAYSQLFSK